MKQSNAIHPNSFSIPFGVVRAIAVVLFLTLSSGAFAQLKEKIDSLHREALQANTDLARCEILSHIAEEYRFVNSDSSMVYVEKAKETSDKQSDTAS